MVDTTPANHILEAKLPSAAIRKYPNLRSMSLHLVEINKRYKATSFKLQSTVKAAVIRVTPSETSVAKSPLSSRAVSNIKKNHQVLNELNSQYSALSNMILNLNTQFKTNEIDPKLITALTKNITDLRDQIRTSLQQVHQSATSTAQKHVSPQTSSYVKKVVNFLNKKFNSKGIIYMTSGMNADEPTISNFIKYENIKNDKGEIEPTITVAISESKGKHWINPNIVKPRPVGNFRLGFQLSDDDKSAMKQIERYIQEQMAADAHLSTLSPKLVPISRENLNLDNQLVTKTVFDEHTITVTFATSIKTEQQAEEAAQLVYRKIHSAMIAAKPRSRDRIVYAVNKTSRNWTSVFKFATGDKFTGRTLSNEESEKLKDLFDDNEIKAIKKALNELPGK